MGREQLAPARALDQQHRDVVPGVLAAGHLVLQEFGQLRSAPSRRAPQQLDQLRLVENRARRTGVGEAVGRSMRFSLVANPIVILLAEMALYGVNPNFNFTV